MPEMSLGLLMKYYAISEVISKCELSLAGNHYQTQFSLCMQWKYALQIIYVSLVIQIVGDI